jgi:tetratricopeptide (TPR) repeat protein
MSADSLAAVAAREPGNAPARLRLGSLLAGLGRLDEAAAAYRAADSLGFGRLIARYNLAAIAARQGRADSARAWLGRAFAAGYGDFAGLDADADFASLRGQAGFDTLVSGARARAFPCAADPRHRAFDFWIGDWDVMANGARVGTNTITRELEGCALYERWKAHPATGSYGHSVNRYDPASGKWRQLWIDANGTQTDYEGDLVAEGIRFLGVSVAPGGARTRSEMTFTRLPDGTVRQFIRTAPMDGEAWTTAFDAIYVRKAPAP